MRKLTEIKQELNDGEENEDGSVKSVTSLNDFNSLLTAIKGENSSLGEESGHLNNITSVTCQVKTEPQSEEENGCELENTAGDHLDGFVIKREIIEVHTEDNPMMDDKGNCKNRTKDEDSGTEANLIAESENDNCFPNFSDNNIDKQKNVVDLTKEMNKRQICGRIAEETKISHTQDKTKTNHKCSVCEKAFPTSQACLKHMWNTHTGENPYTCEVCGKGYKYLSRLQMHKVVHSDERRYSCDVCNKAFKHKRVLSCHTVLCHSDERPYSCDVCEQTFKVNQILQNHKVSCHSSERPYSCDVCKQSFKLNRTLQNHKLSCHSDERPYSCDVCNKAFKQKAVLQRHKACHSNERPYSCDLCNKMFKQKGYVDTHKRKVHSDEKSYP